MKLTLNGVLLLLCLAMPLTNIALAMVWQPLAVAHQGHAHARSAAMQMLLEDGERADIRMILPDLSEQKLMRDAHGLTTIAQTRMSYFHALIAERETNGLHEAAIRYLHMSGKPAKPSPSKILTLPHAPLDIVPDPLPREHWRYLSGNDFAFVLRFQGKPLAGHQVNLTTSNGSTQQYVTDLEGRFALVLPDDFRDVREGRENNRPGEFVLRSEFNNGEDSYITTLSAPYSTNPSHWQSLALGAAVIGGGAVFGVLMTFGMRRRQAASTLGKRIA